MEKSKSALGSGRIVTIRPPALEDKIEEAKCIPPRKNCKVREATSRFLPNLYLNRLYDPQRLSMLPSINPIWSSAFPSTRSGAASRFERRCRSIIPRNFIYRLFNVSVHKYHLDHLKINRIPTQPGQPRTTRDIPTCQDRPARTPKVLHLLRLQPVRSVY